MLRKRANNFKKENFQCIPNESIIKIFQMTWKTFIFPKLFFQDILGIFFPSFFNFIMSFLLRNLNFLHTKKKTVVSSSLFHALI